MRTKGEKSVREALRGFPAFAELSDGDIRRLAAAGSHTSVPAGWTFIREDTPGDCVYVLLSGSARVTVAGETVGSVDAGELVGEVALLESGIRRATVTAATTSEVLHIPVAEFAKVWKRSEPLREQVLSTYRTHRP